MTGRELRTIRLRLGLTQEALAQRLGVIRVTVTRWERDVNPVPPMAMLAVNFLLVEKQANPSKRRG